MNEALQEISMEIISHAGEARTLYMMALESCKGGNSDETQAHLDEAEKEYVQAREAHISLLAKCASDELTPDILVVHAQEHLTMMETTRLLTQEIIEIRSELAALRK